MTKFDVAMLKTALIWAELSHAKRAKIGCVIAKNNRVVSTGYNGRPALLLNKCEDEYGHTLPDVLHAEENAVAFAAREGISLYGATAYITAEPCKRCLPRLSVAGIQKIFYIDSYKSSIGSYDIDYCVQLHLEVTKCTLEDLGQYKKQ